MDGHTESQPYVNRGRRAVWAAIVLSAGLATVPNAAWAAESAASVATAESSATVQAVASSGSADQAQLGQDAREAQAQEAASSDAANASASATASASMAASSASPAASSDEGTYQQAGLHALTIRYVDENGTQIAPTHREAVANGESYSVASPSVGGYELADASQATVAGTMAKSAGDVSVTVAYRSTMATYTVVHERQVGAKSSEYRVAQTERFKAPAGSKVTAAPKSYDNYTCATDPKDFSAEVTPDGNTVIVIKYNVVVPTSGIYFVTNGSYVAPVTGHVGDVFAAPASPERAGYSFLGWDTNGDGTPDALPVTLPEGDVTATAVWKPEQATYLVNYWGEDQDDAEDTRHYHLIKTDTLSGTTESTVPLAPKLDTAKGGAFQWYVYSHEDQGATIAGDGTTVLNVYYDWKRVKVYYRAQLDGVSDISKYPDVVEPSIQKMYDNLDCPAGDSALSVYKSRGGAKAHFLQWWDPKNRWSVSNISDISPDTVLWTSDGSLEEYIVARFTDAEMGDHYMIKVFQSADGSTYSVGDVEKKSAVLPSNAWWTMRVQREGFQLVAWRNSTNVWDGRNQGAIAWGDWHIVSSKDIDANGRISTGKINTSQANVFEFKYDRIPYDVTYYSQSTVVGAKTPLFGSTVDVSAAEAPEAPTGLVFGGWYTDPNFKGNPAAELTVPVGGVNLYAKWVRPNVNVTFDSAGGTPVGAQSVVWDGKAQRPADPVRAGYAFGGWYYFGVDSAAPARFSFDMPLEGDVALVAAWKSLQEPVAYTVRHVSADGSVLAEQVLRGTVGQTVSAFALASDDALRQGFAYVDKAGEAIDLASDASQNVIVFTYANEPRHAFQVHLRDAATGLPVAADIDFDSVDAILNFRAPSIAGYRAAHGGQGYLTMRNGGQELTFWYVKDAEPSDDGELSSHEGDGAAKTFAAFVGEEPGESAASAAATPADAGEARHAAKAVPSTGDDADIRVPAGIAVISAVVVALGFGVRRRAKHAR